MFARSVPAIFPRGGSVRPALTFVGLARWLVVASIAALASTPSRADLTGTTVHGSMVFGGQSENCFAITGCNSIPGPGDTAVVGSGVEFSRGGFVPATADLGPSSLTITFNGKNALSRPFASEITFTFRDTAFIGADVTLDSYGGFVLPRQQFTFGLVDDTITINTPAGLPVKKDPYFLRLNIATVPEPSITALVLAGLLMIGYAATRRAERGNRALRATA